MRRNVYQSARRDRSRFPLYQTCRYQHRPGGVVPPDREICEQAAHKYAAVHMEKPFDNSFVTIPNGCKTLMEYMRVNGLVHTEKDAIPCFETDGESMDIYIACK